MCTLHNVSPTARFSPQRDLLYHWCRYDDLLIDAAIIYGVRCLVTQGADVDQTFAMRHQVEFYKKINGRLAAETCGPSWGLPAAPGGLVCGLRETKPFGECDAQQYLLHLNGLNLLIRAAGGWKAVLGQFAGFTWHLV